MDDAEQKIIEAIARADCIACGHDPDFDQRHMHDDGVAEPRWKNYVIDARRYYARHKARKAFNAQQLSKPE